MRRVLPVATTYNAAPVPDQQHLRRLRPPSLAGWARSLGLRARCLCHGSRASRAGRATTRLFSTRSPHP